MENTPAKGLAEVALIRAVEFEAEIEKQPGVRRQQYRDLSEMYFARAARLEQMAAE